MYSFYMRHTFIQHLKLYRFGRKPLELPQQKQQHRFHASVSLAHHSGSNTKHNAFWIGGKYHSIKSYLFRKFSHIGTIHTIRAYNETVTHNLKHNIHEKIYFHLRLVEWFSVFVDTATNEKKYEKVKV